MSEENSDILVFTLGLLAIATAPIWLPELAGTKAKSCECGAKINLSGITPSCRCYY